MPTLREQLADLDTLRPWRDKQGLTRVGRGQGRMVHDDPLALSRAGWYEVDWAAYRGYRYCTPLTRLLIQRGCLLQPSGAEQPASPLALPTTRDSLPLPITHADFWTDNPSATDWVMAEAAGRRVGEAVEGTLLGTWEPDPPRPRELAGIRSLMDVATEQPTLAAALATLQEHDAYGPYILTLPDEVASLCLDEIAKEDLAPVTWVHTRQLPTAPRVATLFQATPDAIRIVCALPLTVVAWEGKYKALCCVVPQLRPDGKGFYPVVRFPVPA